jgi:hypothetical protein
MFSLTSRLSDRGAQRLVNAATLDPRQLSPRLVYDPQESDTPISVPPVSLDGRSPRRPLPRPRDLVDGFFAYYQDPLARRVLLITSVVLSYVGGLAMFWYHAEHLGEAGPNIPWPAHWFLDSTLGFVGLTPALAIMLPLTNVIAGHLAEDARRARWIFTALVGLGYAVATIPGPIVHYHVAGRETWLGAHLTDLFGRGGLPVPAGNEYAAFQAMRMQFTSAIPLYVGLMAITVIGIRMSMYRVHRIAEQPEVETVAAA